MTLNRFFGMAIPILVLGIGLLATLAPNFIFRPKRETTEPNVSHVPSVVFMFSIVGSVCSNNDSPRLEDTLLGLFESLEKHGLMVNVNPRGCARSV